MFLIYFIFRCLIISGLNASCDQPYLGLCLECPVLNKCEVCLDGYFFDTMNNLCSNCPIRNCQKCPDPYSCEKCREQYFFEPNQKQCLKCFVGYCSNCPIGAPCQNCILPFVYDSSTNSCEWGTSYCATYNFNKVCIACSSEYYLENNQCIDCGKEEGYFIENKLCKKCSNGCSSCSSQKCSSCIQGFRYDEMKQLCFPCYDINCKICKTLEECSECKSKYFLSLDGTCLPCPKYCEMCNSQNCYYCSYGYKMNIRGSCGCPIGKLEKDNHCRTCGDIALTCQSCSAIVGICESCREGYFLDKSKNDCFPCPTGCAVCNPDNSNLCESCVRGYYFDSANKLCLICPFNCESCSSENDSNCQACRLGYILEGSKCVKCGTSDTKCTKCDLSQFCEIAEEGYYYLYGSHKCDDGCVKCDGNNYCFSCLTNYYFENNKCIPCEGILSKCKVCSEGVCKICKEGFYYDYDRRPKITCSSCPNGCGLCNNPYSCEICRDGFFNNTNIVPNLCTNCDSGCQTCKNSSKFCQSCNIKYYLEENRCVLCGEVGTKCKSCLAQAGICDICIFGYFVERKKGRCVACYPGCKACSSEKKEECVSCMINYFLEGNHCVPCGEAGTNCKVCSTYYGICDNCIDGYFLTAQKICSPCSSGCKSCLEGEINECVLCFDGYYFDKIQKTCSPCSDGCYSCSSFDICIKCQISYYLKIGKCVACYPGCKACSSEKKEECVSCIINYFLEGDHCVQCGDAGTNCKVCSTSYDICDSCIDGYFLTDKNICSPCSTGCKNCIKGETTECVSCFDGYYFDKIQKTCSPCSDGCYSCISFDICTKCQINYYLQEDFCYQCELAGTNCKVCSISKGKCDICFDGFYLHEDLKICFACNSDCKSCRYSDSCETCFINYLLVDDQCIQCGQSGSACKVCSTSIGNCDVCMDGYFLSSQNQLCKLCPIGCKECNSIQANSCQACFLNYFLEGNHCVPCGETGTNCKICSTNYDICDSCIDGFFLADQNICSPCPTGCKSCLKGEINECVSCIDGYYFDKIQKTCSPCSHDCYSCISFDICSKCQINYYLQEGSCYQCGLTGTNCQVCSISIGKCDICFDGFYLNEDLNICLACNSVCKTCTHSNSCETCFINYLLADDQCIRCGQSGSTCKVCSTSIGNCDVCMDGYFLSSQDQLCKLCPIGCKQCNSIQANSCQKCYLNYFLEGNHCVPCGETGTNCKVCSTNDGICDICIDGYFLTDQKTCSPCSFGCKNCLNGEINECVSCFDGYYFDIIQKTCSPCSSACYSCISFDICTKCQINYYLVGKSCLKCGLRETNCQSCSTIMGKCDKCIDGFDFQEGSDNCVEKQQPISIVVLIVLIVVISICLFICFQNRKIKSEKTNVLQQEKIFQVPKEYSKTNYSEEFQNLPSANQEQSYNSDEMKQTLIEIEMQKTIIDG